MDELQRLQLNTLEQRCAQVIRDIHYVTEHVNYPHFAGSGFELHFSVADQLDLMERLLQTVRRTLAESTVGPLELKALLAFGSTVDDSQRVYCTIIGHLHRCSPF